MAEPPSSPPSEATGAEDALSWYKAQYELLESELAEFRESSRELEQELEKDIERAEKQERVLKDKADSLRFEVEEWKRKYKDSKSETAAAQASLEKEITSLRDANRTLVLRLRDSEVANDDFERQARNTTSSLEDMESKFNQAVERGVLMEEEIKMGEQEREALRIESQRLREELSELKIEAELMQDKVKKYERHSTMSSDISLLGSPTFDKAATDISVDSAASSPLISTPMEITKGLGAPTPELLDPPSPPMSDVSSHPRAPSRIRTPAPSTMRRTRMPSVDAGSRARGSTPALPTGGRTATGGRPSISISNGGGGASLRSSTNTRSNVSSRNSNYKIPASNSLSHIRLLTAQMQRLEARVHSVRSKLPAPNGGNTPPRPPSRPALSAATSNASTPTVRSRRRATTQSSISISSSLAGDDLTPTSSYASPSKMNHTPRISTSGVNRLSFNSQLSDKGSEVSRPVSRSSHTSSLASYTRPVSRNGVAAPQRPVSRSSISGVRTPVGRPASSFSSSGRGHSGSVSGSRSGIDFLGEDYEPVYRTPSRRGTFSTRYDLGTSISGIPPPLPVSGIPTPGSGIPAAGSTIPGPSLRRQSGSRRISVSNGSISGGGVSIRSGRTSTTGFRKLGDLGETY
ncbi:hypothetical protein TGAMA5MH_09990 [Trichoderma gamsii]|uniref:NUDE domain-containing protein n=1 Tax=Trichoderma gamsii TaxID=398673 RepID=A0A2K0SXX0_9HYPO|nr:hypothetical protein TGAMA5MH_09990 [Trichoderma gamsii]